MNDMMLMALTDPAGAPAHPLIFLVLGVVTFALHLTAVNVMLGTLGLAAWGAFSKNPYWQRLAGALGTTAKVAVSVAIVLGVAPLLFVQVIYDPFWYTSNVISAWWLLGFLAILTVAYLALYRFYGLNPEGRRLARRQPRADARLRPHHARRRQPVAPACRMDELVRPER